MKKFLIIFLCNIIFSCNSIYNLNYELIMTDHNNETLSLYYEEDVNINVFAYNNKLLPCFFVSVRKEGKIIYEGYSFSDVIVKTIYIYKIKELE